MAGSICCLKPGYTFGFAKVQVARSIGTTAPSEMQAFGLSTDNKSDGASPLRSVDIVSMFLQTI